MKTAIEIIAETYIKDFGHHVMSGPAAEIVASLEAAGFRLLPPGHVQLPQSRHEAEVMHIVGERFLKPDAHF